MTARPFNFAPGPATLPEAVLSQASAEMLNWHGCGMGVMEMSHRGPEFLSIYAQAQSDLRALLAVPESFKILFMQGGGLAQNAIVPLNLSQGQTTDFAITGAWSAKSYQEAQRYSQARAVTGAHGGPYTAIAPPAQWQLSSQPAYIHLCANETIHGVAFSSWPNLAALGCDAPLVVDSSSNIAASPIDWSGVGLVYAGAQKNIGCAGLTLVIVREDLLGRALPICPSAFHYATVAEHDSMLNTPPTYAIYIAGLVFAWLKQQTENGRTGVAAMQERSRIKSSLLYDCIDGCEFYSNAVEKNARSLMNVPFTLANPALNDAFLQGAQAQGLLGLKGHKSVAGMRASLFNAMPIEGVQSLVHYMQSFATRHG